MLAVEEDSFPVRSRRYVQAAEGYSDSAGRIPSTVGTESNRPVVGEKSCCHCWVNNCMNLQEAHLKPAIEGLSTKLGCRWQHANSRRPEDCNFESDLVAEAAHVAEGRMQAVVDSSPGS